jgi:hypothetical protein
VIDSDDDSDNVKNNVNDNDNKNKNRISDDGIVAHTETKSSFPNTQSIVSLQQNTRSAQNDTDLSLSDLSLSSLSDNESDSDADTDIDNNSDNELMNPLTENKQTHHSQQLPNSTNHHPSQMKPSTSDINTQALSKQQATTKTVSKKSTLFPQLSTKNAQPSVVNHKKIALPPPSRLQPRLSSSQNEGGAHTNPNPRQSSSKGGVIPKRPSAVTTKIATIKPKHSASSARLIMTANPPPLSLPQVTKKPASSHHSRLQSSVDRMKKEVELLLNDKDGSNSSSDEENISQNKTTGKICKKSELIKTPAHLKGKNVPISVKKRVNEIDALLQK